MTRRRLGWVAAALLGLPSAAGAAYAPQVTLDVPAAGGPSAPAALSTRITQADGETATRTIEARLPGTFGFNSGFTLQGCGAADEAAGSCPESSRIGTLVADSLFGTARGALFLTQDFRLHAVLEAYGGLARFAADGVLQVQRGQEIVVRFDGLPNLPVRRLDLALEGGERTPLALPRDCGRHVIRVRLVSQAGEARDSSHPVLVAGCRRPPGVLEVRVRRTATGTPEVRWRAGVRTASVTVGLEERRAGRWHGRGERTVTAARGPGALALGPRWRGRAVGPGTYRATVTAVGADGLRSLARAAVFRVR